MSDLTASASYFLAAIAENGDRELADDTYRAVAEVLPYHLRAALDAAYDRSPANTPRQRNSWQKPRGLRTPQGNCLGRVP